MKKVRFNTAAEAAAAWEDRHPMEDFRQGGARHPHLRGLQARDPHRLPCLFLLPYRLVELLAGGRVPVGD